MNNEGLFSGIEPTYLRRCQSLLTDLENADSKTEYLRTHLRDFDGHVMQVLTIFSEVCREVGDYTSAGQAAGLLSILDTLPIAADSVSMAVVESWLSSVSWQEMALALGVTGAVHTGDDENREEWFADLLGELQNLYPTLAALFDRFGDDQETQAHELSKLVGKLRDGDADINQSWYGNVGGGHLTDREGEAKISQTEHPICPEELVPYMEELDRIEAIHPEVRDSTTIQHQKVTCQELLQRIDRTAMPELWAVVQTFLGDAYETLYKRFGNESDASVAEQVYLSVLRFLENVRSSFCIRLIPVLQQNLGRLYCIIYERTGLIRYAEQAESAYHNSLRLFADDKRWDEWASVQNSLGHLYADMYTRVKDISFVDVAIVAYRNALEVRRTRPDRHQLGDTENNLAIAYQQMYRQTHREEHARKAEVGFKRALDVFDSHAYPLDWARIRNNLGLLYADIYFHIGDDYYANEALKAYDDALTKFRDRDSFIWAEIMSNRALLCAYRYRHNPEERYLQATADAYRQVLNAIFLKSAPSYVVATARSLALVHLHLEQWEEAHEAFTIALRAAYNLYIASPGGPECRRYIAEYGRLCMWDARCLLHLGDPAAAWSQVEAGRTLQLLEAIGLEEAAYARKGEKGVERIREARRKVQEAESRLIAVAPKQQSLLAQIMHQEMLDEREQARQRLEQAYSTLNNLVEEMELIVPSIKAEGFSKLPLPSSVAAITIIFTVEETVALILHNGRITSVPLPQFTAGYVYELMNAIPSETVTWCEEYAPQTAAQLSLMKKMQEAEEDEERVGSPFGIQATHPLAHAGWLTAYLLAFAMPDRVSLKTWQVAERGWRICVSRAIAFLNNTFWQPILDALPSSVHQVLLSPSGETALLPFHAASIDRITVSYTPSLNVWWLCQQRASARTRHSILMASPSKSLRFAEAETQWLHYRFGNESWSITQLLGNHATASAVCSGMRDKGLIHYAGHAHYNWADPMLSALHCAADEFCPDGKLTLQMIRKIADLRSARLVTLSACESGISDTSTAAEEFLGLPAILLETGAPAVVASLWPAPDASAAFLMDFFYARWLGGNGDVTISEALREAAIWLRSVTKDELLHRIDNSSLSAELRKRLKKLLEDLDPVPFADPVYWAVFAAYGAVL